MGPIGILSQYSAVLIRACPGHLSFARAGRLWLPESIRCPSSGAGVCYLMQSIRVIVVPGFQSDADRGPVQAESVCSETEDGARIAKWAPQVLAEPIRNLQIADLFQRLRGAVSESFLSGNSFVDEFGQRFFDRFMDESGCQRIILG